MPAKGPARTSDKRWCVCGCKRELKDKHGRTDFKRFFFDRTCRDSDKAARVEQQRQLKTEKLERRKTCPTCKRTKKRFYIMVSGKRVGVLNHATAHKLLEGAKVAKA